MRPGGHADHGPKLYFLRRGTPGVVTFQYNLSGVFDRYSRNCIVKGETLQNYYENSEECSGNRDRHSLSCLTHDGE